MATMKHKMGRMAFSKAFDVAYNKVGKDRQKGMMDIFNLAEKYIDNLGMGVDLSGMRACLEDENSALKEKQS